MSLKTDDLEDTPEPDDEWQGPECGCPGADIWFSRTICPEPCDMMHYHCSECGKIDGYCYYQSEAYKSDQRWKLVDHIHGWLEEAGVECPDLKGNDYSMLCEFLAEKFLGGNW